MMSQESVELDVEYVDHDCMRSYEFNNSTTARSQYSIVQCYVVPSCFVKLKQLQPTLTSAIDCVIHQLCSQCKNGSS